MKESILITLSFVFLITACSSDMPDRLKKGLIEFQVKPFTERKPSNKFPSLYAGRNGIAVTFKGDTILADVNFVELSKNLNYEGGWEILNDTLILYAMNLDKPVQQDQIEAVLHYKILTRGYSYKEIVFRELK